MSQEFEDGDSRNGGGSNAEETLRLVARLAPPEELAERVHRRLSMAEERENATRRSFWSLWTPVRRLQFAGAAVLALAVGGGSWSVYQVRNSAHPSVAPVAPVTAPAGGGFGSAGAVRVPPTLTPIQVPPPPKKKPASGKKAAKPAAGTPARTVANPATQP